MDVLYEQTNGDWGDINMMCQYISGVLVRGHMAYTSACVLHKVTEEGSYMMRMPDRNVFLSVMTISRKMRKVMRTNSQRSCINAR